MNLELIAVEYSEASECYVAIFNDGDTVPLEAATLSEAWSEAERIVEYG
jgi:hypothetical protein